MKSKSNYLKRASDLYIKHSGLIGVLYCAIPSIVFFLIGQLLVPFRSVYLLRLGLTLIIGCPIAAWINRHGAEMWLGKHLGPLGPATIPDGTLMGAGVGLGISLLPSLTGLIGSSDINRAMGVIILTYLSAAVLGAIIGTVLAAVGRNYLDFTSKELR